MNETKDYPCELCQGLVKCQGLRFRRIRCKKCGKLYCKNHINNHSCNDKYPLMPILFKIKDGKLELT